MEGCRPDLSRKALIDLVMTKIEFSEWEFYLPQFGLNFRKFEIGDVGAPGYIDRIEELLACILMTWGPMGSRAARVLDELRDRRIDVPVFVYTTRPEDVSSSYIENVFKAVIPFGQVREYIPFIESIVSQRKDGA